MNAMRATDIIRHLLDEGVAFAPIGERGWAVPPDDLRRLCDIADAVQVMAGRHTPDERDVMIEFALAAWRAFNAEYLGIDDDDDETTDQLCSSEPDMLRTAKG